MIISFKLLELLINIFPSISFSTFIFSIATEKSNNCFAISFAVLILEKLTVLYILLFEVKLSFKIFELELFLLLIYFYYLSLISISVFSIELIFSKFVEFVSLFL